MFNSVSSRAIAALLSVAVIGIAAAPATAQSGRQKEYRLKKEVKNGTTVYCHSESITGSMLPHRTCLTREEWAGRGLNFPGGEASNASEVTKKSDATNG